MDSATTTEAATAAVLTATTTEAATAAALTFDAECRGFDAECRGTQRDGTG